MSTLFSIAALAVSIGLFMVHYRNQVERRHGEIVQLKARALSALRSLRQRNISLLTNGEVFRIELRRLPENSSKYELIEKFPKVLEPIPGAQKIIDGLLKRLDESDSLNMNRSSVLLNLQSGVAEMEKEEALVAELEKIMLSALMLLREALEGCAGVQNEPDAVHAPPNVGPVTLSGNPPATQGPPSVS